MGRRENGLQAYVERPTESKIGRHEEKRDE